MVRSRQADFPSLALALAGLCLFLPWGFSLHSQTVGQTEAVIGRAGEVPLLESEFLQRLELLPPMSSRGRMDGEFAKYEVLYSLIAEKLLAQEAVRRGFDRLESFAETMLEIRKLYARDALYRNEVRNRVSLSEQEIAEAMARARLEVTIEFLYFDRREHAQFVWRQLTADPSVMIDSTFYVLRDTATVILGDAQPVIEEAAYELRRGEWSAVVSAGTGYYLLQARSVRPSPYYSGLSSAELRDQVSTLLRRRKEQARAQEFVQEALHEAVGYGIHASIVALSESVLRSAAAVDTGEGFFTAFLMDAVLVDLGESGSDTIAVAGERIYNTGEFVQRLYQRSFPLDTRDAGTLAGRFNEELQLMVRQELLAQEGIRRKLDQRPDVAQQIHMWYDQLLADRMKQAIGRSVRVSPAEAWEVLASRDTAIDVPRLIIRELVSPSMASLTSAVDELEQGETFEEVIQRWSSGPTARTRGGVTEPFPITERPAIGEIAWGMMPGERFGPLREDTSYVIFELIAKEQPGVLADTGGAFQSAVAEVERMKTKRATDVFVARTAQEFGFEIYDERVQRVQISGIPMMTYRFLGFGGRMFAVPLVDRQIDWLNADPGGVTLP